MLTIQSPMIAEFVKATATIPLYQLPAHLDSFPKLWPFPRGDVYHWIPVFDRFDRILELFNQEYGLVDGPQTQSFDRRLLLKGDVSSEAGAPPPTIATNATLDELQMPKDADCVLIKHILSFSRMLLEHCGNRTLYASSSHLDKLLNSTDLSLVQATLELALRLAQRYHTARVRLNSSTPSASLLSAHYNIDLGRVLKIAQPTPKGPSVAAPVFATPSGKGKEKSNGDTEKTSGADMVALMSMPEAAVKQEFGGISIVYYEPVEEGAAKVGSSDTPSTPAPTRRTLNFQQTPRQAHPLSNAETPTTPVTPVFGGETEPGGSPGPKTFEVSPEKVQSLDIHELIRQGLAKLPKSTHYELLNKARISKALNDGRPGCEAVVATRLLAIANLCNVHGDKQFHADIGQQDGDEPRRLQLAYQLAELVHPPVDASAPVSRKLQTIALYALDALAKHRQKAPDVCAALSVNVSHGILIYIVRKAVAELASEEDLDPEQEEWRDALFTLLTTLPICQQRTGEGMVSAGIIGILVEALTLRTKQAERNHVSSLNFLDAFLYNLRDAFQALVDAKGFDIVTDLTSYEVDTSMALAQEGKGLPNEYRTSYMDYQIPFYQQQTIRTLFKFMNHMLTHTTGTSDRILRNFFDSPQLLGAFRKVLSSPRIFGSAVWSNAASILTNFIHNEPTSYAVIAEAGLSAAFLDTVAGESDEEGPGTGVLPVSEAMNTVPLTFDAICVAESGMKLFQSSMALDRFFRVFESPAHIKALDNDHNKSVGIGASFDELVRHHPSLKDRVLACVHDMTKRIYDICLSKASQGVGEKLWVESEDGTMTVAGGREAITGNGPGPLHVPVTMDVIAQAEAAASEPSVGQYIRILFRFLHGFFGTQTICATYLDTYGVDLILDFATLPSLSVNSGDDSSDRVPTSEELNNVISSFVEQKAHILVPKMLKKAQQALDRLAPLLSHSGKEAFFAPFTNLTPADMARPENHARLERGTEYVKSMVTVHMLVDILKASLQGQSYSHRASHAISSQVNVADMYARLVYGLFRLDRACVWEEILLQNKMPPEWEKETRTGSAQMSTEAEDSAVQRDTPSAVPPADSAASVTPVELSRPSQPTVPTRETDHEKSARFINTRTLRALLSKLPGEIAPFCHHLGKALLLRRSLEPYQKQCAILVADQITQGAIDQLNFPSTIEAGSKQDKYAYWVVILDSISQLMIDDSGLERNTHVLTLLLVSFKNLGGIAALSGLLDNFFETAISLSKTPPAELSADSRKLLDLSMHGIAQILRAFSQIINSKVLGESSQTVSLQTRAGGSERDRERADHFLLPQFLVELRLEILTPVNKIWNSDLVDNADTGIVKTCITILKTVLDAEGEIGAYKSKDRVQTRKKPTVKPWIPRGTDQVKQLKDEGYDESLAMEALYRCFDNLQAARDYCKDQKRTPSSNPPPSYEVKLKPPTAEHWAQVVVPEARDAASDESSDESLGDAEEFNTAAAAANPGSDTNQASSTGTAADQPTTMPTQASQQSDSSWDFLAYLKRIREGNVSHAVSVEELDEERANLRDNLIDRSLDILNSHDDVTFELADLISAAVAKSSDPASMRSEVGTILVQSLISLQGGDDFRENGKKIAASAHLLALVLQEKDFYEAIVSQLQENFESLLAFVKIFQDHPQDQSSPWVGPVLLILERLLAEDQLPHQIEWTPPTSTDGDGPEAMSVDQVPPSIVPLDDKMKLFDAILEVLPRIGKDESLALSVTRVLVMLSRVRKIAVRLAEKSNIRRLFLMVRQLSGITNEALRSAFMIVLRHIIEDDTIIREIMRTEIQALFEHRDRRQTDTTNYTRQLYYLALRDPEIFVEVTNEKLQLARFDTNQRPQTLILKQIDKPETTTGATGGTGSESKASDTETKVESQEPKETTEPTEGKDAKKPPPLQRMKTSELKPPVVENPDGVVHYLLCEILMYKDVEDATEVAKSSDTAKSSDIAPPAGPPASTGVAVPTATTSQNEDQTTSTPAKPEKPEFKAEAHPIYIYRCFVLKCLAELLQSYNRCKIEFINFSRKADPHAATPSKPRSGVLNYLLHALVPVGTLSHDGDLAFKKKVATSQCAIDVVVSLCQKTGQVKPTTPGASPYDENEPDLLFVRKFVLEHALKAFHHACSSDEPLDMKYSRLMNLSDIFCRMISQRADGQMLNANQEMSPPLKAMAKIMYEKNLIAILTAAIADIDLNFPNARRVVKYILKPYKWLTTVAHDLSTHYDSSAAPGTMDEDDISSASDDDMLGATREETPDLFRNSTLSMLEWDRESVSEDEDDHGDEDMMYGDEYEDEMDYEEEVDDEDVVSEEDEEMGEMGPIEGLPGDVQMEILEDGDEISDDEDGSDDDDEDDEDDDGDDDDDEDMDDIDEEDDVEELEEITGDDENASLADSGEGDWSGDDAGFDAGELHRHDVMASFTEMFGGGGREPPQAALDMLADDRLALDDYMGGEMEEDGSFSATLKLPIADHLTDEEEEDDYDEDIVYEAGGEDDEALMDYWAEAPVHGRRSHHALSPWMFPGGPGDRILVPAYRSHRPGIGSRTADDGTNPLLQRSGRSGGRGLDTGLPVIRHEGAHSWTASFPDLTGNPTGNPTSLITNLLQALSQGGGASLIHPPMGGLQVSLNSMPGGLPPVFDTFMPLSRHHYVPPGFRSSRDAHTGRASREDPHSAVAFHKAFTNTRWQEEAKIMYGQSAAEKSARVINSLFKLMVPPALEAAKKREAERQERALKEQKEREEREAKEREKEEQERKEREEKERQEREERERQARLEAERQAEQAEQGEGAAPSAGETAPATSGDQAMEGVEGAAATAADQGLSQAHTSQIINVQGREIDIGALGIDMDFLEALPEELREEVLVQQITEQRLQSQENDSGEARSQVDPAFLDALPENLREEVLQQERQERRRREREEARRQHPAPPVEIDNATLFETMDPHLRSSILQETSEEVLRTLPPHFVAEARELEGDRRLTHPRDFLPPSYRMPGTEAHNENQAPKKKRPCVQMLDKAGVATLLRLMFVPQQGSAKAALSQILKNVCENRQNRAEVISLLLSILQDGSADVNAVERSFAQLSIRAKQPPGTDKTPKAVRKSATVSINPDVSPLMVVQQCLQALKELVANNNYPVWHFFLSEHETGVGFRNRGNRKGKGKETKATRYPINALLSLLERKLIVESSSLMEQLTSLLHTITQPLAHLKKDKEEKEEQKKAEASASEANQAPSGQGASNEAGAGQNEDTEMASAPEAPNAESSAPKAEKPADDDKDKTKKHKVITPPEVPEANLRLVAKILAARECNSRVFQETLSIINNLSPIPGAKEVFGKELLGIAQELAQTTLNDLAILTKQISDAESSTDIQGLALSKFSPQSSDQTKLLRALTALDYLFNPSAHKDRGDALETAQKEDILVSLYESSTFAGLWQQLSQFLKVVRERGNMISVATILLPLIEALMVVCKNTTLKDAPLVKRESAVATPAPENKMEELFFQFTEDHRKILNELVKGNPKLMSGTFSLLVKNSKVLEFDNKRNYFNRKLHSRQDAARGGTLGISVRRDQVFLDSYKSLYFKSADELKYGKLNIRFHGEEGVDAGGVTREWFQVIARQMFDPSYALFTPVASDRTTFHPNQNSWVNEEHLYYFKFIGRIIGKALYEGRVLDCYFSRAVYKRLLGKSTSIKDMETLDPEYYKSLQWMLTNDITDVLTETFSVDVDSFGAQKTVDLVPNGRNIPVTDENKHEYVRLVTEYRLTGAIQDQLNEFLKGFHDIIPAELVAIFSEQELELLISGLPNIDVEDWKNNTEYHNYTAASPQIQWFWRAVRSFDQEERAKLLQFVTGTSKVPLNGFKELEGMNGFSRFNIHRDYGSKDRLPSSHTCFNRKFTLIPIPSSSPVY